MSRPGYLRNPSRKATPGRPRRSPTRRPSSLRRDRQERHLCHPPRGCPRGHDPRQQPARDHLGQIRLDDQCDSIAVPGNIFGVHLTKARPIVKIKPSGRSSLGHLESVGWFAFVVAAQHKPRAAGGWSFSRLGPMGQITGSNDDRNERPIFSRPSTSGGDDTMTQFPDLLSPSRPHSILRKCGAGRVVRPPDLACHRQDRDESAQ